ncbi:MAG: efflux RND transporter periplasmic adaptor subunit [Bacteroidetes bacterium]|nr:efflux RND transporter periplasmic adaptor subunit [Bacteroidota bacterium]
MFKSISVMLFACLIISCNSKVKKLKPAFQSITESIYASGVVKSENQYQAFSTVNGIINQVFVSEGDTVKVGTPILSIANDIQRINKDNAELTAAFADIKANQGKLSEAKLMVDFAFKKMKSDSLMYYRQKALWEQQVGTRIELEQKELAFQNAVNTYYSSIVKLKDLERQLNFNSNQSKKNLAISNKITDDYIVRSEIEGVIYSLTKTKGEMVGIQSPLCVIGNASEFILEMQVDEFDIFKIQTGMEVAVTLDSYKGKAFKAKVTKVNPLMNERSKTFLVEAEFIEQPALLYPNISFEANIVLASKEKALLIPRNYLINDSMVIKGNGDKVAVKTGLMDYQKAEIISGITADDYLIEPTQ